VPDIQETLTPFFPLPSAPREKQVAAMDFIFRMVNAGYRDIVVSAPTGVGKTGVGLAACLWSATTSVSAELGGVPGGYYLVTQKLLQDQITADFDRFASCFAHTGITLKTASEYPCGGCLNCAKGHKLTNDWFENGCPVQPPCNALVEKDTEKDSGWKRREIPECPYDWHKQEFITRPIGVTNYAYWLTEKKFVDQFPTKNVLICDECHSLEKLLLQAEELVITSDDIHKYSLDVSNVSLENATEFLSWLKREYEPSVDYAWTSAKEQFDTTGHGKYERMMDELERVQNKIKRIYVVVPREPENWVFWSEPVGNPEHPEGYDYMLKPLSAAPYFKEYIGSTAPLRIYLSAYPGPKNSFCRSLGLDPSKVAWKNFSSPFPISHRPVHMAMLGSMGRKSYSETLPRLLSTIERILKKHANKKGLIHCHSYSLGRAINDRLATTEHAPRVLFPALAKNRNEMFKQHRLSTEPTVLLSPSMTEGFSLDDELARFQIIAKIPFPYLGDKQVAAKKNLDPEWYTLQTVMTIIQACGRIVRSDTDYGDTYILDRDFYRLYNEDNLQFFPKWFEDSFVWHIK